MLDLDRWQELFETVRRNRLRAALTSLSVAWGIFLLVVLLGAGNGLRNGVVHTFADDATNSVWLFPGTTATPHEGLPPGRRVRFTNTDYERVRDEVPGVDQSSGRFRPREETLVAFAGRSAAFDIRAVHPEHRFLEKTQIVSGRFLSDLDLAERRKVAVVGTEVTRTLAGGADLVGETVAIGGLPHLVVGVFEDEGGEDERRRIYVPISTAQVAWGGGDRVDAILFTVREGTPRAARATAEAAVQQLAERHKFDPTDKSAVRVRNNVATFERITTVLDGISTFVWLIGLGTIVAGIVGVSNIMLISVKERTREIGLRKALGATPGSIVGMILLEAVVLTAVAGYLGLAGGIAALEVGRSVLPETAFFRDPQVSLGLAVAATIVLVAAGALAGYFPARRAAAVDPVVALRDE